MSKRLVRVLAAATLVLGAAATLSALPASADTVESTGGWNLDAANRLTVGGYHSCAILNNGSLKCWGKNDKGQLGIDSTTTVGGAASSGGTSMPPAAVDLGSGASALAVVAGDAHTCVILSGSQQVKCWGDNSAGQLGYKLDLLSASAKTAIGDEPGEMAALGTVNLGSGRFAKAIAANGGTTCVIMDNDQVKCWGDNSSGKLGQNSVSTDFSKNKEPADYPAVDLGPNRIGITNYTAKAVAVGPTNVCVVIAENLQPKCWGTGTLGANGLGNSNPIGDSSIGEPGNTDPIRIGGPVRAMALVGASVCAIINDGDVKCWGNALFAGQDSNFSDGPASQAIGDGSGPSVESISPVKIGNGRKAVAITSGADRYCVTLDDGTSKCWGNNGQGRNGYGTAVTTNYIGGGPSAGFTLMADLPALDFGGAKVQYVTSGGVQNCAVMYDATVRCWGLSAAFLGYDLDSGSIGTPTGSALSTAVAVNLGDFVGTASTTTTTTTTTVAPTTTKASSGSASGSGSRLKPVPLANSTLPRLSAGSSSFTVGGKNASVSLVGSGGNIVATAGSVKVTLSSTIDGAPVTLGAGSALAIPMGATVSVAGTGFKSGSTAALWVLTGSKLIGSAKVAADGSISVSGSLLASLGAGNHTLQVSGTRSDGKVFGISIGFTIAGVTTLPATGDDHSTPTLMALMLLLAGCLVVSRRRMLSGRRTI